MPGLFPSIGRRHFLASVAVGAIGSCLPLSSAHAATTPPSAPGAASLQPGQLSPNSTATIAETSLVGTAAAEQSGDTSIRPFKYRATDEELADLKRRVTGEVRPPDEPEPGKAGWVVLGTGAAIVLAIVGKLVRRG